MLEACLAAWCSSPSWASCPGASGSRSHSPDNIKSKMYIILLLQHRHINWYLGYLIHSNFSIFNMQQMVRGDSFWGKSPRLGTPCLCFHLWPMWANNMVGGAIGKGGDNWCGRVWIIGSYSSQKCDFSKINTGLETNGSTKTKNMATKSGVVRKSTRILL
jgi:hypothetical protein